MPSAFAKAEGSITGVTFFPSLSIKQEMGTLGGDQTALLKDIRLGYSVSSGWYFGILYSETSTLGSVGINQTTIGNSVGYFYNYLSVIGTYILYSKSNESTASNRVARTEGSGYQIDLSYMFPAMAQTYIGPVITYRVITFGKEEAQDGTISNRGLTETFVYPFFGAIFLF
jgi:hypothetical protein